MIDADYAANIERLACVIPDESVLSEMKSSTEFFQHQDALSRNGSGSYTLAGVNVPQGRRIANHTKTIRTRAETDRSCCRQWMDVDKNT